MYSIFTQNTGDSIKNCTFPSMDYVQTVSCWPWEDKAFKVAKFLVDSKRVECKKVSDFIELVEALRGVV